MTEIQETMLVVCFGGMVGLIVGNVIELISEAIYRHRRKKNKK